MHTKVCLFEVALGLVDLAFTFHLLVISRLAKLLLGCALRLVLLVLQLVGPAHHRAPFSSGPLMACGGTLDDRPRPPLEASVSKVRSSSVVVLATADGATHGAQDPQDRSNHQQDDANGYQYGEALHE